MIETIEHGTIRELRLNRPPANALSPEMLDELHQAVQRAPDEGVAGLVLSGTEGMFSGGLDVPLLLTLDRPGLSAVVVSLFDTVETLAASVIPVAVAITGHSPAGGAVLALMCDRRFMAEGKFVIGLSEVRVGLPMPEVVCRVAARQMGPRAAEELCVTGTLLSPQQAQAKGLVDEVVPAAEVVERACTWCRELSKLPGRAVGLTRQLTRRDLIRLTSECCARDRQQFPEEWFHPEVQAGLKQLAAQLGKA